MQTQLTIDTNFTDTTAELHLKGRLNSVSAEYAEKAVLLQLENPDGMDKVQLDLSELTYLASAGLRIFVIAAKTAKAKGREFTLVKVPKNILEVLSLTGLTGFLNIEK